MEFFKGYSPHYYFNVPEHRAKVQEEKTGCDSEEIIAIITDEGYKPHVISEDAFD